jgi:hypothetical protein
MLISEALVMLAPYGVERIERIPAITGSQTWKVTHHGEQCIYACQLESLVWALTPADDWEG